MRLLHTQRPLLLQCLFSLLWAMTTVQASFVVTVPWRNVNCFVIRTPPGPEKSLVSGSFDLMDDHLDPTMTQVLVLDEDHKELYMSSEGAKADTFQISSMGRLNICVRNGLHLEDWVARQRKDKVARRIGLHVQVKTLDVTNSVHSSIQKVNSQIWNFRSHHDYMRTRELEHRTLAERTFSGMLFWAILEALFVLLAGCAQVFFVRRFFEKQRRLY